MHPLLLSAASVPSERGILYPWEEWAAGVDALPENNEIPWWAMEKCGRELLLNHISHHLEFTAIWWALRNDSNIGCLGLQAVLFMDLKRFIYSKQQSQNCPEVGSSDNSLLAILSASSLYLPQFILYAATKIKKFKSYAQKSPIILCCYQNKKRNLNSSAGIRRHTLLKLWALFSKFISQYL